MFSPVSSFESISMVLPSQKMTAGSRSNPCSSPPSSSPSPGKSNQTKVVHFHRSVSVREVPMRKDVERGERESVWFMPHEYHAIKERLQLTAHMMRLGDPLQILDREESDFCTRGLEWQRRECSIEFSRQAFRKRGLDAVIQEQCSQRHEERVDPERLADVYGKSTEKCNEIAHWIAMMGAQSTATDTSCSVQKFGHSARIIGHNEFPLIHHSDELALFIDADVTTCVCQELQK